MQRPPWLDELAARLVRTVPTGVSALRSELEDNFRVVLQAQLERLNVVSRDRFDLQAERLTRAQQRIAELEARLSRLETRVQGNQDALP